MATSTQKAIACIRVLLDSPQGTSVLELASRAGISRPAATRLVDSLIKDGLIIRDRTTKRIRMGLRLYEWTSRAVHRDHPLGIAQKEIVKLVSQLERRVNLIVLEGTEAVYLDHYEWLDQHVIVTPVPSRALWALAAGGKAIVAFSEPAVVDRLCLEAVTENPSLDDADLRAELKIARERGYAEARGSLRPDIFGIAVPVLSHSGLAVASIGTYTTEAELAEDVIAAIALPIRSAARRISQALGYHPERFADLA